MKISSYGRDAIHTLDGLQAIVRYIDMQYEKYEERRQELLDKNDDLSPVDSGRLQMLEDIINVYAINSK